MAALLLAALALHLLVHQVAAGVAARLAGLGAGVVEVEGAVVAGVQAEGARAGLDPGQRDAAVVPGIAGGLDVDVLPTQAEAIERARVLGNGASPLVERVRKTTGGKPDKWRKA